MQEWMLMGAKPVYNSGFEQEEFDRYATDSFQELLDTSPIVDHVIIYNTDMSESKSLDCIIQGNLADAKLKSLERIVLCPIGTLKAGMYIFFDNSYWLVNGRPGTNKIYEKATLVLCTYLLKWQNVKGDILERWVNILSASKYNIGESSEKVIVTSENNYIIQIPYDEETINLEGKRVFIDKRKVPEKVFKITRDDDVLYDFGDQYGSILNFICDKTELNMETDNRELHICDYFSPTTPSNPDPTDPTTPNETANLSATISGNTSLKIGFERSYCVNFTDQDSAAVTDVDFEWKIDSKFADKIKQTVSGRTINLHVDDDSLIGESFFIEIIIENKVVGNIKITIVEAF